MHKPKAALRRLVVALACLGGMAAIYYLPPVHARLAWRLDQFRNDVRLHFNPPDQAVFVPGEGAADPPASATPAGVSEPTGEEATATPAATPLPVSIRLPGVIYVDQHNRWNYCGPANLTMALKFWGWAGNRDDVAMVVRPGANDPGLDFIQRGRTDLNVMPGELVDFVNEHTGYRALWRHGGDVELLKRMLAAGFPAIIEKGYVAHDTTGKLSWMGHYEFVTGYDQGHFIVQDAYDFGPDYAIPYEEFVGGWRSFDYLFILVYPPEGQEAVTDLLGPWAEAGPADQIALQRAIQETQSLADLDLFFAWFNLGTSQTRLGFYSQAAASYDRAFQLYAGLETAIPYRPYRLMWYQVGPYQAYFQTGRYQDVIDLANATLSTPLTGPTLEESLYWRALAEYALGDYKAAYADVRQAIHLNANFKPALAKLQEWGINP